MPTLRVLRVDPAAASLDPEQAARLIAEVAAGAGVDVAVLHGAPSLLRWRSRCAALARRAGLVVVTGGRTAGGTLLLSTLGVDVDAVQDLTLPGGRGPRRPGAALAAVRREGASLAVAGARFASGAGAPDVAALTRALDGLVTTRPPHLVVAGGVSGAARSALDAEHRSAAEGIWVDPRLEVAAAEPVRPGAVRVELSVPA